MDSNETNLYLVADEAPNHSSNNYNNKTQLTTMQGIVWIF